MTHDTVLAGITLQETLQVEILHEKTLMMVTFEIKFQLEVYLTHSISDFIVIGYKRGGGLEMG